VSVLEEALAMRAAAKAASDSSAWTKHELAKAVWEVGRDRKRAVELAREAREEAETAGDAKLATEARAWLSSHPAP
jgi:hypothetical protein